MPNEANIGISWGRIREDTQERRTTRDDTPPETCGECRSIECICAEVEEVLNSPIPSLRFSMPTTNSNVYEEDFIQETYVQPTIHTSIEYNDLSEYLYTPKHERKLTLRCDNSCGAVMCQVCMSNLDYYLDF